MRLMENPPDGGGDKTSRARAYRDLTAALDGCFGHNKSDDVRQCIDTRRERILYHYARPKPNCDDIFGFNAPETLSSAASGRTPA